MNGPLPYLADLLTEFIRKDEQRQNEFRQAAGLPPTMPSTKK